MTICFFSWLLLSALISEDSATESKGCGWGDPCKKSIFKVDFPGFLNAPTCEWNTIFFENKKQLPGTTLCYISYLSFNFFLNSVLCFVSFSFVLLSRNVPKALLQDMDQPDGHSWCPSDFQLLCPPPAHELYSLQRWKWNSIQWQVLGKPRGQCSSLSDHFRGLCWWRELQLSLLWLCCLVWAQRLCGACGNRSEVGKWRWKTYRHLGSMWKDCQWERNMCSF